MQGTSETSLTPQESSQKPIMTGLEHRGTVVPLCPEELQFEIDMCIGCDRCMLACPVPISEQVAIADLNRATVTGTFTPQLSRFTDECVMCGSCVPVCPVDNHRDLLMLSLKQRLGEPWHRPADMQHVMNALPGGWQPAHIVARLREQPMLRDPQAISDNYLLHLIAAARIESLAPGATLIREGEYGRDISCILEGQFALSQNGPDGAAIAVAVLNRGEYLGDYGMLTGQQHNATARASSNAVVLTIPEQVMQHLIALVPAVGDYFTRVNNARSFETILKRMALFQGVPEQAMQWLVSQTHFRYYERSEQLFSENGNAETRQSARESLHIVLEGFVKVARATANGTERVIAYRQSGDYFAGGLDMLGDREAVTATAITRARVAEVPRLALQQLFAHVPVVAQRFNQQVQQYRETLSLAHTGMFAALHTVNPASPTHTDTANPFSDAEARRGLHALVSDGVVEGTEVLVIDLEKCIHCSECEEACARRHGHSRMNRKGMVIGNITITTACRQCQDPVCLLCSRAGIVRKPGGEVYITESCIGCGICAERCPYDNITIVPLSAASTSAHEAHTTHTMWQRFSSYFKEGVIKERGSKVLPVVQPGPLHTTTSGGYDELRKKIAVKCDLCAGYDHQACVQACPTGAAMRVQPATFFGTTEDILRWKAR